jgi:hypothetical protein
MSRRADVEVIHLWVAVGTQAKRTAHTMFSLATQYHARLHLISRETSSFSVLDGHLDHVTFACSLIYPSKETLPFPPFERHLCGAVFELVEPRI